MVPRLWQGGHEAVCVQTARYLEEEANVSILIFDDYKIHYDITGLDVVNINVSAASGVLNKFINIYKRIKAVKKIKKEKNIDVTYSFGSSASIINVLSRVKDRIVVGFHGGIMLEDHFLTKLFCRKSDAVIAVSKEMTKTLKNNFGQKNAYCIYNPFDFDIIDKKSNEEVLDMPFSDSDRVIVTVGREDDQKGYWHLLKAFSMVRKVYDNARLLVIGSGDFTAYKKLCDDLKISDSVVFTGVKKNPFCYEKKASEYVLTSNHEGFPGALVEAMSLGIPVIATDCKTGPREILLSDRQQEKYKAKGRITRRIDGEYGILIPDLSHTPDFNAGNITQEEQNLASCMLELFEDEKLASKMAKAGKDHVEIYSKEHYVKNLKKVLGI